MNINKTKLYENFDDIDNKNFGSNLGVTSCNVLGSKENIESNTGFFLLLIILAIFIIIFIIFCSKGYRSLENKIDEVIYKKFKNIPNNKKNKSLINNNNKIKKFPIRQNNINSRKKKEHKF